MRAMILLGLNAGLGNTDVALLKAENLDLNTCWIDYPRPKTGTVRRAPLWPETVSSLAAVSKDQSGDRLFFIGPRGVDYVGGRKGYRVNQEFVRVATVAKVTGHSFYDLRRTFQTIGEGCHDLSAVQAIMGHAPGRADMSAIYRQGVEDDRLQRVVDHVREWLFGGAV
jgi:integrase